MLNRDTVARTGLEMGMKILVRTWSGLAPSMKAASSSSLGTAAKKFITRMTLKMGTAPGKTRAQTVLSRP